MYVGHGHGGHLNGCVEFSLALAHASYGVRADFHVVRLVSFGAHEQREMPTVRQSLCSVHVPFVLSGPTAGRAAAGPLASSEL